MHQENRCITSREYKLMVNVDRFRERESSSLAFWQLVQFLAQKQSANVVKEQHKEEKRVTWYLDTPEFALRQQGFVMRVREESGKKGKEYKTTLKYRSGDRYISASQNVASSIAGKFKFEEDILPPFRSKFSHSNSIKTKELPDLDSIENLITLFPGLSILNLRKKTPVTMVNGLQVQEVFRKVAQLEFGKSPKVKLGLSFWYLFGQGGELPLVGEFSFDYDDDTQSEQFPIQIVTGTNRWFQSLQKQSGWFNFNSTTKTSYAYDSF